MFLLLHRGILIRGGEISLIKFLCLTLIRLGLLKLAFSGGYIWLLIILKVTKKLGFTLSLGKIFLEKLHGEGMGVGWGQIDPQPFLWLIVTTFQVLRVLVNQKVLISMMGLESYKIRCVTFFSELRKVGGIHAKTRKEISPRKLEIIAGNILSSSNSLILLNSFYIFSLFYRNLQHKFLKLISKKENQSGVWTHFCRSKPYQLPLTFWLKVGTATVA